MGSDYLELPTVTRIRVDRFLGAATVIGEQGRIGCSVITESSKTTAGDDSGSAESSQGASKLHVRYGMQVRKKFMVATQG